MKNDKNNYCVIEDKGNFPKIMFDTFKPTLVLGHSINVGTQLVLQWFAFFIRENTYKIVATFLSQNLQQSVDLILIFFK